jgi:hypothetical protein
MGVVAAILVVTSGSIWGASWREINSGLPSAVAGAGGLAIDPTTPSTLYSWAAGELCSGARMAQQAGT